MTVERVEVLMGQSHDEGSSLKLVLRPNKTLLACSLSQDGHYVVYATIKPLALHK